MKPQIGICHLHLITNTNRENIFGPNTSVRVLTLVRSTDISSRSPLRNDDPRSQHVLFYPNNEKSSVPCGAQDDISTSISNNLVLGAISVMGGSSRHGTKTVGGVCLALVLNMCMVVNNREYSKPSTAAYPLNLQAYYGRRAPCVS